MGRRKGPLLNTLCYRPDATRKKAVCACGCMCLSTRGCGVAGGGLTGGRGCSGLSAQLWETLTPPSDLGGAGQENCNTRAWLWV